MRPSHRAVDASPPSTPSTPATPATPSAPEAPSGASALCALDHLTVVCRRLAEGVNHVERCLGVPLEPGGAHPRMGTHNALLHLGDDLYLEVLAIDRDAPAPPHPRWFGLDRLSARARPRLAAWAARTQQLNVLTASAPEPIGSPQAMARGGYAWTMGLRDDGTLPLDGAAPLLLQWQSAGHPARQLPDRQCRLRRLDIAHPDPARLQRLLVHLRMDGLGALIDVHRAPQAGLTAHIDTRRGRCVLHAGAPA
ncbi:VOC family protein [Ideonella sp.]|uniref:VOC family protein n=1 Tax=Ideonella sp. TaxID=1929293 RepID=UPI0035B15EBB